MGPYGPRGFHGGMGHGWFWVFSGITMVLFWVVLLLVIVLIARALTGRSRWAARGSGSHPLPPPTTTTATTSAADTPPAASTPEGVLAERLARGDIDVDDYHRRLAALHQGTVPPPPSDPPAV